MALSVVQTASNSSVNVSTVTVTLGSATTAGNTLLVFTTTVGATNGAVSGVTIGAAADNFAVALTQGTAGDHAIVSLWTDPNCVGGQTSVVVTQSGATGNFSMASYVMEVSGLASVSVVDKSAVFSSSGFVTSWSIGPTATTTQGSELWVGFTGGNSTGSTTMAGPSSPWNNLTQLNGAIYDGSHQLESILGWQIVSSTGTVTYAGTSSGAGTTLDGMVVSLKAAASTANQGTTLPVYTIQGNTASPVPGPKRVIPSIPQSIPKETVQNNNIQSYPFALTKPRPLNLIGLAQPLVPQNPANRPNVYIQGQTATDTVSAYFGTVFINQVTHLQNAFPVDQPYPLSIIGNAKLLIPQHPNLPITPTGSGPVSVSGLVATVSVQAQLGVLKVAESETTANVNVASSFGGFAVITQTATLPTHGWPYFSKRYIVAPNKPNVFVSGITPNVNVAASFGTINIFETEATSNVSVAAPFGGSTIVHQTTSMPSHGWPYFSKRYIVAPNKPNVFINGITAAVNISSSFGSITVSEAGTAANVNVVAQTGNIGNSAKPATPNVPIASYPFGLIGKTLRQQNQASKPNVYVPGLSASVAVSAGSAFKTYSGSNFTQQFPVTTNVPYPLNVISRLRPQNSYVTSSPPTSVNITGQAATVNVASNFGTIKVTEAGITPNVNATGSFGSVYIFSPKPVPAPFANSAPYPLNITTKLRPQNVANRASTIIRGITSTVGVQSSFGIIKSSSSATTANVNVASAIGSFKITAVAQTTIPRYPVSSYPFSIIGKTLRPQTPSFVNTVHAYAGQVSAETVHAGLGIVTVSVTENKSVSIVAAYPGTVKIGTTPVFSWRGKVAKGPRSKIRLSV